MDAKIRTQPEDDTFDGRLTEALDVCLERVRAGVAPDEALAAYPDLAAELAPLLAEAARLGAERRPPAPAPTGLALGRARFLEAAARAPAAAAAAVAPEDPRLAEALDESLARLRAGEAPERAVAAYGALRPALAPLLATAGQVVGGRRPAPPPPRGLRPGRARFLAAAAALRAERAERPAGLWAGLLAALGLSGSGGARRLALGALGLLLLISFASGAATVTAQAALPGDPLYGVKRWTEGLRYRLAVDPVARDAVLADQSRERAEELAALTALGRSEALAWEARYLGLAPEGGGRLLVQPLDGASAPLSVAWTAETRLDLGPLPVGRDPLLTLGRLAPGTRLFLQLVTAAGGPPRLVLLRVLEPVALAELPPAVAPAAPATAAPETATPAPTAPPSATRPPASATPAATTQPTATPLSSPTAAATVVVAEEPEPEDSLSGYLAAKVSDGAWRVGDQDQGGRDVDVDVSAVRASRRDAAQVGYFVKLIGRWGGPDRSRFIAADLIDWSPPACQPDRVDNRLVTSVNPGVSLRIEAEAADFWFTADTVVHVTPEPGMRVNLRFQRCAGGRLELLEIAPAETAPLESFVGTVRDYDPAAGRFTLDDEETGEQHRVRLAPGVKVNGVLAEGVRAEVLARREGGELLASEVSVLGAAPVAPTAASGGPTLVAPATAAPPVTQLPPAAPTAPPGLRTE